MIMKYDYLIIGSGLYGATFACLAKKAGKRCLVIDKRPQLGGNLFCRDVNGIHVHAYGAHIFHTSSKAVWDFVNSFSPFNRYTNSPVADYKDKLYNLPFNMNTFYELWGTKTPEEARAVIDRQKEEALSLIHKDGRTEPQNLEEQALCLVGRDIYEKLIKGYTEKQWGRKCTELPSFIIKRLPVRFTFDNNYFNSDYQGIPRGGYNKLIEGLLKGADTKTGADFFADREGYSKMADKVIFTGKVDEFFDYKLGKLEYRTVRFETETLNMANYQGNAVVNYTAAEVPYTRIIEHKHFEFGTQPKTVITKEYPAEWHKGNEPYYPINDEKNNTLFAQYQKLAEKEEKVLFGGRLGQYKYYDMDKVIDAAVAANL